MTFFSAMKLCMYENMYENPEEIKGSETFPLTRI